MASIRSPFRSMEWLTEESSPDLFNFGEIEARQLLEEPENPECLLAAEELRASDPCTDKAEILKKLIEAIIPDHSLCVASPQAIGLRVIVLAWIIQSDRQRIGSKSFAELAKEVDVSRAIFSHICRQMEDEFKLHARGQKRVESRVAFCEAASRGWVSRRETQRLKKEAKERQNDGIAKGQSDPQQTTAEIAAEEVAKAI